MGVVVKLIDAILFLFFIVIATTAPMTDAMICFPANLLPEFLVNLSNWYAQEFGDYLVAQKPHFFVGIVWLELLFQWPLALINLYAILGSKPWLNTTCLIYGVSVFTGMVAILSELIGSGKASAKLLMTYVPFSGLGVLAMLRGLLPSSAKTVSNGGNGPALARKKRA